MPLLVTQAEIEQYVQVDFTNTPEDAVTLWIAAAQGMIESYCHREFDWEAGRTDTIDGRGDRTLRLSKWPVNAVNSVTEDGTALTVNEDYAWYENGRLVRLNGSTEWEGYWSTSRQSVVVDYDAGYSDGGAFDVPEALKIACGMIVGRIFKAGAAWANTPEGSAGPMTQLDLDGVGSVAFGGGTVSPLTVNSGWAGSSAGDAPGLTSIEKATVSKYRYRHIAGSHKPTSRW